MNKPHNHAELIKAWSDGAKIQVFDCDHWRDIKYPVWYEDIQYRIKPEEKKPIVRWLWAKTDDFGNCVHIGSQMMTEEEAGKPNPNLVKLIWSRTEFDK